MHPEEGCTTQRRWEEGFYQRPPTCAALPRMRREHLWRGAERLKGEGVGDERNGEVGQATPVHSRDWRGKLIFPRLQKATC